MRTWIFYVSRQGSVERCARYLERQKVGFIPWDLKDGVPPFLRNEDRIILASGVYNGKLAQPVCQFLDRNRKRLEQQDVSLLVCCQDEEQLQTVVTSNLGQSAEQLTKVVYGGYMHRPRRLNPVERLVGRFFAGIEDNADHLEYQNLKKLLHSRDI